MRRILALAILLAASTAIAAEPPKISAPATAAVAADDVGIAVGRSFTVPLLIGSKDAANIAFVERVSDRTQLRVVYVRADGTLGFVVYGISRQDGPGPDPKPDPQPDPKPDPIPVKVAFIHVVRETGENTPAIGAVVDSKPWRDVADSLKITYRVWDVTSAEKPFPNIVAAARKAGLPAVVFLDAAGAAVAEKLPATADAMTAMVKQKGGAK